jgi:hypothetical protein
MGVWPLLRVELMLWDRGMIDKFQHSWFFFFDKHLEIQSRIS